MPKKHNISDYNAVYYFITESKYCQGVFAKYFGYFLNLIKIDKKPPWIGKDETKRLGRPSKGLRGGFSPVRGCVLYHKERKFTILPGNFQKILESMFTNPKNYGILL